MRSTQLRSFGSKPFRAHSTVVDSLSELTSFGPNPGGLAAKLFVPDGLAPGAPLVVALHGCTQSAEGYCRGAGWAQLASDHGFAVLLPEQRRANNPNLCFNWFERSDIERGKGEPASIRQMIAKMIDDHAIDVDRVFITGLSAGAAMACVMLAAYPEVFAGGGLIAGLPYATATSMPAALQQMRMAGTESGIDLAMRVQRASDHAGPWPRVSVWHGATDRTVDPTNADAVVAQWCAIHGLDGATAVAGTIDGHATRTWVDAHGAAVVQAVEIGQMGHGTPIDSARYGTPAPFMLDVGVSSSEHLAAFWGLTGEPSMTRTLPEHEATPSHVARPKAMPSVAVSVERTIHDALRAAGLMR